MSRRTTDINRAKIVQLRDEEGLTFTCIGIRFDLCPSTVSAIYRQEKHRQKRKCDELKLRNSQQETV